VSEARSHLEALVAALPVDGAATVPVAWLREVLTEPQPAPDASWRSRLWLVSADTLLSTVEAAEAMGKTPAAVHKLAQRHRLPCTRSSARHSPVTGAPLLFRAGDLRRYLEGQRPAA
jgi:hypothetical protein